MAKGIRGGFGNSRPNAGGGMNNMNMQKMMQQAQAMQREMEKEKDEISSMTFEASAGGGAVKVVMDGEKKIKELEIKPEVVDPDDVEMLQDLVMAAVNEAMEQVDKITDEKMGKYMTGLSM